MQCKKNPLALILYFFVYAIFLNFISCTHVYCSDEEIYQRAINQRADEVMVKLAYSNEQYRNVGALYKILKFPCFSPLRIRLGSVAYIGGHSCISSAHCFKEGGDYYFTTGYQVSFELSKSEHSFFDIQEYVAHSDYQKDRNADIAMIRLVDCIPSLTGMQPSYMFGKQTSSSINTYEDALTYVGYGHGGNDGDYFIFKDNWRRACMSRILDLPTSSFNLLIRSVPYKLNVHVVSGEEVILSQRSILKNEFVLRRGMSGGATFCNDKFVGINSGINNEFLSYKDYLSYNFAMHVSFVINLFNFSPMYLRMFHPFVGLVTLSVPLGRYEEWIEKYRAKFDELSIVPQSEVITVAERGFDIEGGNLETRHSKTL